MAGKFKTVWFWANKDKLKDGEYNNRLVDLGAYAQTLKDVCEQLEAEGYDVISVVPISAGTQAGAIGFSPTVGAVVVGKKHGG